MSLHRIPHDYDPDPLAGFDYEAARRDGWTLSDCGFYRDRSRRIELQKHDDPPPGAPVFREDREAWAHVVAKARLGSPLHCLALDLVDPRERRGIEASCGFF